MHVLILISIYCFDPHMFQWTFNLLDSTKGYTKQAKEALMSDLCHWSEESLPWINWYMASVFLWGLVSGLVELEKSSNCFHYVIRGLETQYRVVYLKLGTASLGIALVLSLYQVLVNVSIETSFDYFCEAENAKYVISNKILGCQRWRPVTWLTGSFICGVLSELRKDHVRQREGLVLTKRPVATIKLFSLSVLQQLQHLSVYIIVHWHMVFTFCVLLLISITMLVILDGPHEKVSISHVSQ
jgi:hypothetical protein